MLTVSISPAEAAAMRVIIEAVESVIGMPAYQQVVLEHAQTICRHAPGPLGCLLGYDFHLTPQGPVLIEINTNAGGILLCHKPTLHLEQTLLAMFHQEWELADTGRPLIRVAIIDDEPERQFLLPEFQLFQALFQRHGITAHIAAPEQLSYRDGHLWLEREIVDLVYNRLTDFTLTEGAHAPLREAYLANAVVVTPHPHAHALYADKRNFELLCNPERLRELGVSAELSAHLAGTIPQTTMVNAENADALWQQRRQLFFKPAHGYGSKGTYNGERLTRRVWAEFPKRDYVAQQRVPPSCLTGPGGELKVDLRHYTYAGQTLLRAARLYRGQTTNLRTPGGGFAQVEVGE
jgi:hypothetical protein